MTPLAYSVATACAATSLSKSQLDRAIRAGLLKARKSSTTEDGEPTGKYVILADDLEAYLASLPEA
jgi:hypothetical protein